MTQTELTFSRRQTLAGLGGASALAIAGCSPVARPEGIAQAQQIGADRLLEVVAYNLLEQQPTRATGLGVDTGQYAHLRGKLGDASQAGQDALAAQLRTDLERVRNYPREGLNAETITNLEVVESAYDIALEGLALPYGDVPVGSWRTASYVVIQNVGSYLGMPRFMQSTQPVANGDDADAYIERLEQFPAALDGELERIQAARGMGVTPPDFLLDLAIGQLDQTLASASKGELFAQSLRSKLSDARMPDIHAKRALTLETGPVVEALARQVAELKTQRAVATSDPGISARPYGEEFYAWALRSSTTTNLSPDEVHQQGLEQLAELHGRMDPILKEVGYTKGSVGERMQALGDDPRFKWPDNDEGRAQIMEFIHERIDWIRAQMPRAFNTLVDPNLEVKRIPPAEELGAPGAYGGSGSKDGTIPGRFWINLSTTDRHRKYDLADLTFHESIPGHVWEGEFSNRLPLIRSILAFNPFSEGWALYGEQMADELGAYDEFKVGRLGYLQSLAFRACRMVVDTGLHAKGWSRERARNFFIERNGSKPVEVFSEVDRYCSWPGQATGYKLGHSEIVRHRSRAQSELGQAYDFKAFNDAVILGGNVPMDVLAKNVDRYIAGARG